MQKIGCRLLCFIANADSCLCNLEHGKGQLDFFQNHVNRWWLPYLANICMCWLWRTSQNEHQLSVRYFLAFGTRWSFCYCLFFHVLLEQYAALLAPPLWQTVHHFSPPGKDLVFPNHCFLSAPVLSSFHPPLLLRREHSLSLEGLWWIHVRIATTCRVCTLTCCLCHPDIYGTHRKYFRFYILEPIKIHLLK